MPAPPADRRHLVRGALLFTLLALFWATENPWQSAIVGRPLGSPFPLGFFYWLVHWWVWAVLALGVARLARRYPPSRKRPAYLLFHLAAAVVVSTFQIARNGPGSGFPKPRPPGLPRGRDLSGANRRK